ncbi:MAG: hypothetical protein ACOY16_11230 [Chloroflexota bacterium]
MSRIKVLGLLITGAVVATLAIGAVSIGKASASISNALNNSRAMETNDMPEMDGPIGIGKEALAQALGISVSELETAIQKAQEAALADAVEKGVITQAQADAILSRDRALPFGGRWNGWLARNGIDFESYLAEALGISTDELKAARQKAAEIAIEQAVEEGRITQEQADLMKGRRALFADSEFRSAIKSAFETAVKSAAERGVITQAQADLILQRLAEGLPFGMDQPRPGFGGFPGGGRHGGPGFGGAFGVPPATPTSTP